MRYAHNFKPDLLVFEAKEFFLVLLLKGGQFEFTQRIDVNGL